MKTQAQLDVEYKIWLSMVDTAVAIRNRIYFAGGMATKTIIEDELMPMFGIDRGAAHDITNYVEYHNLGARD